MSTPFKYIIVQCNETAEGVIHRNDLAGFNSIHAADSFKKGYQPVPNGKTVKCWLELDYQADRVADEGKARHIAEQKAAAEGKLKRL